MKVKDIYPRIKYLMETHPDDELHVVTNENVMGGTPTSKVKHIAQGIDWDTGRVLIICEDKLIKLKK